MYSAGARIERAYLAPIFEKGQGLEQYYTKAKEWYANAVKKGLATAKLRLSAMHQAGDTGEQNSEKAMAQPGQAEE
jgi:TPR repeat protein